MESSPSYATCLCILHVIDCSCKEAASRATNSIDTSLAHAACLQSVKEIVKASHGLIACVVFPNKKWFVKNQGTIT